MTQPHCCIKFGNKICFKCYSRGGTGGPDPPGKSQVIWVSIGDKQLEPPWKKLDPLPLENVRPPLEPMKVFLEMNHLTSVK